VGHVAYRIVLCRLPGLLAKGNQISAERESMFMTPGGLGVALAQYFW
jgi:hypothetical protein